MFIIFKICTRILQSTSFILYVARVQLQQPGIQHEEMNSVGDETASQFSWTAYLFQV